MTIDVTDIKKIERTPTQALVVEVKVPLDVEEEDIGKYRCRRGRYRKIYKGYFRGTEE